MKPENLEFHADKGEPPERHNPSPHHFTVTEFTRIFITPRITAYSCGTFHFVLQLSCIRTEVRTVQQQYMYLHCLTGNHFFGNLMTACCSTLAIISQMMAYCSAPADLSIMTPYCSAPGGPQHYDTVLFSSC
jgi:hypothetical protein